MKLDGLIGRGLIIWGVVILASHAPDVLDGARLHLQGEARTGRVVEKTLDRIGSGSSRDLLRPNLVGKRYDRFLTVRYPGADGPVTATAPVFRAAYRAAEVGDTIALRVDRDDPQLVDAQPWGVLLEALWEMWLGGLFIAVGSVLAFVVTRRNG